MHSLLVLLVLSATLPSISIGQSNRASASADKAEYVSIIKVENSAIDAVKAAHATDAAAAAISDFIATASGGIIAEQTSVWPIDPLLETQVPNSLQGYESSVIAAESSAQSSVIESLSSSLVAAAATTSARVSTATATTSLSSSAAEATAAPEKMLGMMVGAIAGGLGVVVAL